MLLGLLSSVLFLGGCGGMVNQNNSTSSIEDPDTAAFKDEFTQEFLVSNEEVVEGYYLFESATNGYQFHFPINGYIEKEVYERNGEGFESVSFFNNQTEENLRMYFRIIYENGDRTNDIDLNLELLSSMVDYEGDYEEYSIDDNTFYYGENVTEYEGHKNFIYFTYIKPNSMDKGVSFMADVSCEDISKACTPNDTLIKDRIKEIMHSFDFESR